MSVSQGREGFNQFFAGFDTAVSDGEYTFEDILGEGHKVMEHQVLKDVVEKKL